jgi:hypothetical protein
MAIVISSGHGKYVRGAMFYLDEVDEARKVVERVADYLRDAGVTVKTFHDNTSTTQNQNLNTIVAYHNAQTRDLDVSVHFNAYQVTSSPMGTECLYVTQKELAYKVSAAIAGAGGFIDRGAKYRSDLFFLNNTEQPAILIETCFVDSRADADLYRANFVDICAAIAEAIGGVSVEEPPEPPERPERPPIEPPAPPSDTGRPMIGKGDYGPDVLIVQQALGLDRDSDFGPQTEAAVIDYQRRNALAADGIIGNDTWGALERDFDLPPYPPPLPEMLSAQTINRILSAAERSALARYSWQDRGIAPIGYTKGMAVAYALVYRKLLADDLTAKEMAKADTRNDEVDALAWYDHIFVDLAMSNHADGPETLRHVFVLLIGLGMRESSGRHCEGRDTSADNVSADTAEAGLFQTSWNASSSTTSFINLLDQYASQPPQCHRSIFADDVSCSASDWESYGSGTGREYQELAKACPQFAVETTAVGLRLIRQHWGPINRHEAEVLPEADRLLFEVQTIVDEEIEVA